jgi:hypothetical protein
MRNRWLGAATLTFAFGLLCLSGDAQEGHGDMKVPEPLKYVRIYSDEDGESHFADEELSFELVDFAPPAPPISVTHFLSAENVGIISSPSGWHGDWHPAPRRQLMFCLSGELEVEVSDGEIRRFGGGCVLLVEDTHGKGHVSRVTSDERGFMASVSLPPRSE